MKRLLLIQTSLSYKLNLTTLATFTKQNGMVEEVTEMIKRLRIIENTSVSIADERAEKLEDLLLNMVDETLKQVFREEGTKVIFVFINTHSHLKQEEIAEKPEVFSANLKKLMGSGAFAIERLILKKLYSKLELKFEEKESYEFSDYIKELRRRYGC